MITELWWKVFIAAIITTVIAKLSGCEWGIVLLFTVSFIGWVICFILFVVAGEKVCSLWKRLRGMP